MFSRSQLLRYAQLLLVCVAMITMLGAGNSDDARFQRIGHEMMCACGCGQILLECNHVGCTYSSRMIDELHTQIGTGGSDKAILTWFAAKYGAVILAAPIRGGFDDVAWIMPIAILLLGTIGTAFLVRAWRARRPAAVPGGVNVSLNPGAADALRDRIRKETQY